MKGPKQPTKGSLQQQKIRDYLGIFPKHFFFERFPNFAIWLSTMNMALQMLRIGIDLRSVGHSSQRL